MTSKWKRLSRTAPSSSRSIIRLVRHAVIPGEFLFGNGDIQINSGAARVGLEVLNTGDRPVQVGSHFHFAQANAALSFDRAAAFGHRLDIPAGTAVRFEPGVGQR